MKNKITFLVALSFMLCASQTFAQYSNIDFEPAGSGAGFAWTVSENGSNPALAFIANPDMTGANTSATVTEFVAEQAGNPWALCFTDDITPFTFDATNSTVKIMVWKPTISNVAMKFEMPGGANHEIQIANTVTSQWEEITFDFSSQIGVTFSRMVIIPDFVARTQDNTLYFDNIQVPDGNSGGGGGSVDSVDVTFTINASSVTTSAEGLYLAGGALFGVPGDNPMTDNGSDVWTITKTVAKGLTFDYTFTNGFSGSWGDKEDISGQSCAVAPYNDRQLMGAYADTTILGCFGDCMSDGTCPGTINMIDVTFQVDVNAETVDPTGIFLGGDFEGWSGGQALTDADADGVWDVTLQIAEGSAIQFKFINGAGWVSSEQFDATHSACTQDFGGFINRVATLGNGDTTMPAFIYNSCDLSTVSTKAIFTKNELFTINPTLVTSEAIINFNETIVSADKQIQVVNAVGQVVMTETVGQAQQYRLNASNLTNGLYFVVIQSEGFAQTARILVSK
ncbi:MAG: hypothetical protein ACI97N_000321 [Cognaticolwellia sp.]|jgi:hypothetical protein